MPANQITPTNPRLAPLLNEVTRGNVKIPVFQREFVWTDEQVMGLLDSIYRGYPVGSLLLWSTKNTLDYQREVGGFKLPTTPADYPVNYVLDGQQRLTTLYGVFNSDAPTEKPDLAARFNVMFVPSKDEFMHASVAPPESINLRVLLDTTRLLPELRRFSDEDQRRIAAVVERFKDYEFPVVTIKDRSNQEVCRIFQRINSSGTSLSTLELLAAWTWSDKFDLRREIEGLQERLADRGYGDLEDNLLMRCLAAVVTRDIETDSLVDAPADKLVEGMVRVKEAMNLAIDFLEHELKIRNVTFVPFPIMLVPLVQFFAVTSKPNPDQRKELRRWFWNCAFTQRYRAGTNRLVREDLAAMDLLARGGSPFSSLNSKIDRAVFMQTWRINSTAAKAMICMLAQYRPMSFPSGAAVDLGRTMAAYNAREFHHIYPKAHLASLGIQFHQSNVLANICMLTADDNKAISDDAPSIYMPKIHDDFRKTALDRALVPPECQSGVASYADFVLRRSQALALTAETLIRTGNP